MYRIPRNRPADRFDDYEKYYDQIEALKADYSDNPHIVQMVGEDHGYIIEVYFYSDPERREFFWVRDIDLNEMAVQLTRELCSIRCSTCNWLRHVEVFVAQQFLKKIRFNNLPTLVSSATLDRPILPKNQITEFVQYELGRHMREKHAIHGQNSLLKNQQKNEQTDFSKDGSPTD